MTKKKVLGDPIIIDGRKLSLLYGTSSYERRKSYDKWDH